MNTARCLVCALLLLGGGAVAQDFSLPTTQRVELDNGTVLILSPRRDVPMIGVEALLRGGAASDPAGKEGLASLYASLLEKGAGERDALAFAETVDSAGARLSARAGREAITVSGDFLARDAELAVELLSDMLIRPSFAAAELEKLRERMINFILAAKDSDPGELLSLYGHAFLFGEHPYGNPAPGSEASLASITLDDIETRFEQMAGGDRLIIAVSGDFDMDRMRGLLSDAFGNWQAAQGPPVDVPTPPGFGDESRVLLVDKPGATQTYFWLGGNGVTWDYPQRAALDVVNTVFGGRFTSMLNTALRVESGLTYGASSNLMQASRPGSVAISSFTRTDATEEAIDLALDVLRKLHERGIPADMIESAQNYVLGQFPTQFETAPQLAGIFALLEFHGEDSGFLDSYVGDIVAVTPESASKIIDSVFPSPNEMVYVLIGDAEKIRDAAGKYGPVTEVSLTDPRFHVPN